MAVWDRSKIWSAKAVSYTLCDGVALTRRFGHAGCNNDFGPTLRRNSWIQLGPRPSYGPFVFAAVNLGLIGG